MQQKIFIFTQGCRLNQSESASLIQRFIYYQFEIVNDYQSADVVVINTCTVTEKADRDTYQLINKISKGNKAVKIAIIGCQAEIYQEKILSDYPDIKWVIGTEKKHELPQLVRHYFNHQSDQTECMLEPIKRKSFFQPFVSLDPTKTRVNLKIQEGCDQFCSYCVVPYARGPARSRDFNDIKKEAKALAELGVKEIVLTGVNISLYQHKNNALVDVLCMLSDQDGIERIRLSSIEPYPKIEAVVQLMRASDKLCPFLHLPLQSGSNDILKQMNRPYDTKRFLDIIQYVKSEIPDCCIGTDIIVGFPGETDTQFQDSFQFFKDNPFAYAHVFVYSDRPRTKSLLLEDKVRPSVAKKRSALFRQVSQENRLQYYQSFVETIQTVLIEEKRGDYFVGLTPHYIRVKIKADTLQYIERNTCYPVRLIALHDQGMIGEFLN